MRSHILIALALCAHALCLASCDDTESEAVALLGGGPGSSSSNALLISPDSTATPAGYTQGQSFTTMSSEFGYVDNPAIGGSGDPGTTGNWYTGAGGQSIGLQTSTGVSLPADTEIAIWGSTAAAQNQPVTVTDLDTGQTVATTIVDVGPGQTREAQGYAVDITYGTARSLGIPVNGSNQVTVTPLSKSSF
jgi:hypothetical protein